MPGETWRGLFQAAVESTYGTPVTTATRRLYFTNPDSVLSREQGVQQHRFATGTRDNVRAATQRPVAAGGTLIQPVSPDELVELCLITLQGGVTPTAGVWTFVPGSTAPNSATMQWHDGANVWQEAGVYGNRIRITGAKDGDNMVNVDLFGADLVKLPGGLSPAAGGLTQRVPSVSTGFQSSLFIDAFAGTPGTTALAALLNWDITFDGQLGRKYYGQNSLAASAITLGEIQVQAQLTVEAAVVAFAEFDTWVAGTKRLIRTRFHNGSDSVDVDIAGIWSAQDLGQNGAGTRIYRLTLDYVYDPTNTFGFRMRLTNGRATAW